MFLHMTVVHSLMMIRKMSKQFWTVIF